MILDTSSWGWPQYAMAAMLVFTMVSTPVLNGKPRKPWNWFETYMNLAIQLAILICGGFFK